MKYRLSGRVWEDLGGQHGLHLEVAAKRDGIISSPFDELRVTYGERLRVTYGERLSVTYERGPGNMGRRCLTRSLYPFFFFRLLTKSQKT